MNLLSVKTISGREAKINIDKILTIEDCEEKEEAKTKIILDSQTEKEILTKETSKDIVKKIERAEDKAHQEERRILNRILKKNKIF